MFYVTGLLLFFVTVGVHLVAAIDYYNSNGVLYIKPDSASISKSWQNAQSYCKSNDSTLGILDTAAHRNSFIEALNYFRLYNTSIWIGANASYGGINNWKWLYGANYTGPAIQGESDFIHSFATISKPQTSINVNTSSALYSFNYLCQYREKSPACASGKILFTSNGLCYVVSNGASPWFTARNNCLLNGGELAIFPDLSSISQYLNVTQYWVGLRNSWWNWQNAVTGTSFDVTYTFWANSQPNDNNADCMFIESGAANDSLCQVPTNFICQKDVGSSNTSTYSASTTILAPNLPTSSASSTTKSSSTLPKLRALSSTYSLSIPSSKSSSVPNRETSNRVANETTTTSFLTTFDTPKQAWLALALGVAVGIGVPAIVIIIVIITIVNIRRRSQRKAKEQNTTDQSESLPQTSLTPPTYMHLKCVDKKEGHEYAKIGYSPDNSTRDYLELQPSGYVNYSELA